VPRAARAVGQSGGEQNAPKWLRDAVAGVWGPTEWAQWTKRVRPALEERGVTEEMLEPVYGGADGNLIGIAAQPPAIGWRVGWLGHPKHRRAALLQAASALIRELDAPAGARHRPSGPTPGARTHGEWLRRGRRT
jgi:hypothetical protein